LYHKFDTTIPAETPLIPAEIGASSPLRCYMTDNIYAGGKAERRARRSGFPGGVPTFCAVSHSSIGESAD
jgi:hypothetical protein